jgi:hypothetical protein
VQQDRAQHGSLGLEAVGERAFGETRVGHGLRVEDPECTRKNGNI